MSDLRTAAMQQALEALRHGITKMNHAGFAVECMPLHYAADTLRAALAADPQPVAVVTECEACFTPDVCRLRGTCDHYSAERLRVAAEPQPVAWLRWEWNCTGQKHLQFDPPPDPMPMAFEARGMRYFPLYTAAPTAQPLTDEQIDRMLSAPIPGGSQARDWFLPHEHQQGLQNVRVVVREMLRAHGIGGTP